ncbi:MAG TPA: DUF456 domain-containing protein [Anaerolineales bacterium]|nr:DUF456 domain-containing protein [Anaerolineales bacterium]
MNIESFLEFLNSVANVLMVLVAIVSLLGLVVPIFPGTVIIWLVTLIYGMVNGFGVGGGILFAIITILMIASTVADNVMMGAKARENGASWLSIGLALGTAIIGTMIFPPIGGLIGAPIVLFVSEYNRVKDREKALTTVKALALGWGWAFVARFGIGVLMLGLWLVWALINRG